MRKVLERIDRSIAYLDYGGIAAAVICLFSLVMLIVVNVILRYFFNHPLLFGEEYSQYLFIIVTYMSFAYTTRVGGHIQVELVIRRFSKRARDCLEAVTLVFALFLISLYFWFAWALFVRNLHSGITSSTVMLTPLWIPQISLWVGMLLFGVAIVARIIRKIGDFKTGSKKREENSI